MIYLFLYMCLFVAINSITEFDYRYSFIIERELNSDIRIYYDTKSKWLVNGGDGPFQDGVQLIELGRDHEGVLITHPELQSASRRNNNYKLVFKLTDLSIESQSKGDNTVWLCGRWRRVWKQESVKHYLYPVGSTRWTQIRLERKIGDFEQLHSGDNNNTVTLFSAEKSLYIRIDSNFTFGYSLESINNTVAIGNWMD